MKKNRMPSTAGFEPARAKPNRFQVCLLNHSDISTLVDMQKVKSSNNYFTFSLKKKNYFKDRGKRTIPEFVSNRSDSQMISQSLRRQQVSS